MKTIQRTMKYMVCLSLLLTVKQFASAGVSSDMGPGNGGGNGGNGFLMQELKAANPGLSAQEIILKAFNDSEGRVPKLQKLASASGMHGFFKLEKDEDYSKIVYVNFRNYEVDHLLQPIFYCRSVDYGPLLGDKKTNCSIDNAATVLENLVLREHLAVNNTSKSGLVLTNEKESRVIEYRQLSENEIVFVTYPNWGSKQDNCLVNGAVYKPTNGICGVGYLWSNEK